jgi:hypothetical protein
MPTLSGAVSRIFLFLKAVRYGRHEEILPEFLLTVKNLSFAPGGPRAVEAPRADARGSRSVAHAEAHRWAPADAALTPKGQARWMPSLYSVPCS